MMLEAYVNRPCFGVSDCTAAWQQVGACMTFLMSYMLQLCGALICVMIHQVKTERNSSALMPLLSAGLPWQPRL